MNATGEQLHQLRQIMCDKWTMTDERAGGVIEAAYAWADDVDEGADDDWEVLANGRIRAALAVMTRLGYRGDDLDLVRRLVDDWVGHELMGVAHDMIGDQLCTTAEEDGDSSLLFVLEEMWPDIVMESAAIAARWNPVPLPPGGPPAP